MIIAQVIHTIEASLTMSYYTDPTYFSVWNKIMMPKAGPPPTEFYYYSLVFSFITGLFFTIVYKVVEKSVPGKSLLNKGLIYGLLIWLVAGLSGSLSMVLLVNLPVDLVAYWTVSGLIVNLLAGVAIAKIIK
jgi:uncharacterized membrane protein YagU involved in acid resistance